MDINGATAGFTSSGAPYGTQDWAINSGAIWTTSPTGTTATSTWADAGGSNSTTTTFKTNGTINQLDDFTFGVGGGISVDASFNNTLIIRSLDTTTNLQTITMSGGTIHVGGNVNTVLSIQNTTLTGSFEKTGGGVLALSAAGAKYAGTITVTEGYVSASQFRFDANTHFNLAAGGTLSNLQSGGNYVIGNLSGAGNVSIANDNANTKLTITQTADQTFSGQIAPVTAGHRLQLIKSGSAALTLSGNSSFSGTTTISAGTLIADHSNAFSSLSAGVIVQNVVNATLRINDGITLNANSDVTLSGINSILDVGSVGATSSAGLAGDLTAASGGIFKFDLNGTSAVDLLTVGGLTDLSGAFTFNFNNLGENTFQAGVSYKILDTQGSFDFTGATFSIGSTPVDWTGGSLFESDGDLFISFAVVPEPSAWLLFMAGCTTLVVFRRRKRTLA